MFRVAAATAMLLILVIVVGCSRDGGPAAGPAGVGDPYLPEAGNGGYDVAHYGLDLVVDPISGRVGGSALIQATATQDLGAFNLDFDWSGDISSAEVDGRPVEWERHQGELTITCPEELLAGDGFTTHIVYSGLPKPAKDVEDLPLGWQKRGDTIYTLDQPTGASTWFPVNDHPSDKATYTIRLTVPKPYVGAANGVLVQIEDEGADRTFVWEMKQPMASYLASVSVAGYVLEESTAPNGTAIRNYFDRSLVVDAGKAFARTGEVLAYFASVFGAYPFDVYGVVVPAVETGAAMENQTLSLYGEDLLRRRMLSDTTTREIYLSHELAHQWFGNSVTMSRWDDIWLNEGFATYASFLWVEHDLGPEALQRLIEQSLQIISAKDYPPLSDPGLGGLFSPNVYRRGALTLHALRLTIGDQAFFALLKEWASRYKYGNATTEDFIAMAKANVPGGLAEQLTGFFDEWLSSDELPLLPTGEVSR
jgi:aminopeptidase N